MVALSVAIAGCAGPDGSATASSLPTDSGSITLAERAVLEVECLAGRGFEAEAFGEVVIGPRIREDQELAYEVASDQCDEEVEARYPGSRAVPRARSDEELADMYRQQLEVWECLRDEGYEDIPAPPSVEAWIESWRAGPPWDPYVFVSVDSEKEWVRINEKCPQAWTSVVIMWDPIDVGQGPGGSEP